MDRILEPHKKYASAFIDDIAVFSNTFEEHVMHVDWVLTSLEQSGITLKLIKSKFAQHHVLHLGHEIGSGQHQASSAKVEVIKSIKVPETKKQLKSFLGLIGYYRSYIERFAEIALPLTKLTKNNVTQKLIWEKEHQLAFDTLKQKLCETPARTPNFNQTFIIRADASKYTVAVCLAQEFVNNNGNLEEHPIAYASNKLSESQINWSIIEKEAYSILFGLKTYDYYVFGAKVIVYSDHNPLTYLFQHAPKNARLTRWILSLQRYNFEIRHLRSHENAVCDALTRLPLDDSHS